MSAFLLEGGPFDGETVSIDVGTVLRMPVRLPDNVRPFREARLAFEFVEYIRSGQVYRWSGLVSDGWAEMSIALEAFADPAVRRYARQMLRETIERDSKGKVVDRIVWVVARDPLRSMFTVVAVVGGRRAARATTMREELRSVGFRLT